MCSKQVPLALMTILVCVLGVPTVKGAGLVSPGGLKGEYFNNLVDYWPYGTPEAVRIDPQIDFTWGNSAPAPGVNASTFTVLWTGYLEVPATDTYTFTIQTDDRVTLRIGDTSVVSYPPSYLHPSTHQGKVELTGGQIYPFRMTYQVNKDEAGVQLFWESASLARQIVPASVLQPPLLAEDPTPADGAVEVVQDVTLKWAPGSRATHHDLYLSEDPNAVTQATIASPGVYRGRQPGNVLVFHTGPLKWGRTYYWRVDEVNEAEPSSPWKGSVWSFTTAADYIPVDDFESYTDEDGERIYETWIDGWTNGTGSLIGFLCAVEFYVPPIHGGREAMPFDYNNTQPPYYSEAYRTWDVPQDWTINGVSDLSLWLRGNPIDFRERPDGTVVMSAANYGGTKGTDDVREFAYKHLSGDGEIVARVDSLTRIAEWTRAGVIMRESFAYGSPWAALTVTADYGVSFAHCGKLFGPRVQTNNPGAQVPHWVKLTRRGDVFTAQHSDDGVAWQHVVDADGRVVAVTITMSKDIYVGLCVVGYWWRAATAEFSGITTSGAVSGPWHPPLDDTCIHTTNSPDRLYAAIEDKTGRVGVAVHPDPAVTNLTEWTQWRIPLSRFDPVNLKAVKKMYLGVGDRYNSKPNHAGLIYIDDIRLIRSLPPGPPTTPEQAVAIYPGPGAADTPQSLELRWLPGQEAARHDIYFGDDANAVANATPTSTGIYRGRQALDQTVFDPGSLDWHRSYFWRIDEVNDGDPQSPWKGHVWSFTTADCLVLDDFESYYEQEGYRLYEWWIDGLVTGDPWYTSTSIEYAIVRSGRQAMALDYNNVTLPYWWQVEYWWTPLQDWTVNGGDTLVLFVRGRTTNDLAPLYVGVEDSKRNNVFVAHPDPQAVRAAEWLEWRIPLSTLAGLDLAKVRKMYIGVGDRINPVRSGTGTIYIDDIRVVRSTPHP